MAFSYIPSVILLLGTISSIVVTSQNTPSKEENSQTTNGGVERKLQEMITAMHQLSAKMETWFSKVIEANRENSKKLAEDITRSLKQQSDDNAIYLKELSINIAQNLEQMFVNGEDRNSKDNSSNIFYPQNVTESLVRFKPRRLHRSCPLPWQLYKGICMLFFLELRSWSSARKICISKGGDLVWIEDILEHNVVNEFMKMKLKNKEQYLLGLHCNERHGPLQWTNGTGSTYRGTYLQNWNSYCYIGYVGYTNIKGIVCSNYYSFLCRRV